jgi:hypothetical protein
VRPIGSAFNQQMGVVGHQTVREKCKTGLARGALELRNDQSRNTGIVERLTPLERAEREEIAVRTEIVESGDAWWA